MLIHVKETAECVINMDFFVMSLGKKSRAILRYFLNYYVFESHIKIQGVLKHPLFNIHNKKIIECQIEGGTLFEK